ncbi:MAG TPA: IS256 family transposase [Alphaproteobacteria bacterium]|nr:IS256 family transposase [Alphaproteobacteria bacterium]
MQAEGVEWGEDYHEAARLALAELLEGRMAETIDRHLERMAEVGAADRRNGCYTRWLLTELGEIELHVPRTRTFSALKVVQAYARRAKDVDRMILACFLLGLSTRKVAIALLPVLGRPVSPATVSAVARQLDAAVAAFHRRPLGDIYQVLVLDGVVLRRKTGAGALARPVLVALGLRPDAKKEVIDFRLATAESAAQWEQFLGDLIRRGLTGERLDMLCVDGGSGLLAALPTAFPDLPVQRCWAHKIRNVLSKVREPDQAAIKADLHRIMNATTLPAAWAAARRFADRWAGTYPQAVACLRADLDDLLTCFRYATLERKAVRTTNAIERRFREVRRRTRPMGTFQDKTSMERILFAVFMHENRNQDLATPFALTHNS